MKTIVKTLALTALVAAAGVASAADTGTLTNTLTITSVCSVAVDGGAASTTTLGTPSKSMGTIPQGATQLNNSAAGSGGSTTTYGVSCGSGVAYTLTFDQGANPATTSTATAPMRRVVLAGTTAATNDYVSYNLYMNGTGGTSTVVSSITGTGNASGNTDSYSILGKVTDTSTSASHRAGTYTDTVNVALTYM